MPIVERINWKKRGMNFREPPSVFAEEAREEMTCEECGETIPADEDVCSECGWDPEE